MVKKNDELSKVGPGPGPAQRTKDKDRTNQPTSSRVWCLKTRAELLSPSHVISTRGMHLERFYWAPTQKFQINGPNSPIVYHRVARKDTPCWAFLVDKQNSQLLV